MKKYLSTLAALVVFLCAIAAVGLGLSAMQDDHRSEQLAVQRRAVERAAVLCYAVEGAYPAELSYLEERYGLIVDRERYIIRYESYGANIRPEIAVFHMPGRTQ